MTNSESMITPALAAAARRTPPPFTVRLERERVARMADALEEDAPPLRAAPAADGPAPLAPPWALFTVRADLRLHTLPDLPAHGLLAAHHLEILAPFHIGETLTITSQPPDLQERIGGRIGHSLLVHHSWDYTNQRGEPVARSRETIAYFHDRPSALPQPPSAEA